MKKFYLKTALALAALGTGLAAVPAQAVQISFSGGTTTDNPLVPVFGSDGIGDTWEMRNGPGLADSMFGMADHLGTPQTFNSAGNSSGLGTWANSFQLSLNSSQTGGFSGILTSYVPANNLTNHLTVGGVDWAVSLDNLSATSGLYQQIRFTAPLGASLAMGQNFSLNVNFAGVMSNTSGWAASWDDRAHIAAIPEPETYAMMLAGLGLLGFYARRRRNAGLA